MCPIVVAVAQLYVQGSSLGILALVGEACALVELADRVRLLLRVGLSAK
jgi:hypothetical protein